MKYNESDIDVKHGDIVVSGVGPGETGIGDVTIEGDQVMLTRGSWRGPLSLFCFNEGFFVTDSREWAEEEFKNRTTRPCKCPTCACPYKIEVGRNDPVECNVCHTKERPYFLDSEGLCYHCEDDC